LPSEISPLINRISRGSDADQAILIFGVEPNRINRTTSSAWNRYPDHFTSPSADRIDGYWVNL